MELKTTLLPYQEKAFDKLKSIVVGALYMEMGTGKTRVALELINHRKDKVDKVLWLCPYSVKYNLELDLNKHADNWKGFIEIHGIESLSSSLSLNIKLLEMVKKNNTFIIVDESNLIKNPEAIRTQNILRLSKYCRYKLILNGTPVSRNEADLFAQWFFLDWRILGYRSYNEFARNHVIEDEIGEIKDIINVEYLVKKIAPYSYHIKKSDCLTLPGKEYYSVDYYMDGDWLQEYSKVADKFLLELDELVPETIYNLFTALQKVITGYKLKDDRWEFVGSQERLKALKSILKEDKTIIYCKYTDEVKYLYNALQDDAVMFYGEMSEKERKQSLISFRDEKTYFIASKQCAGYGLNLQFCNKVIYYSNDWDYATRIQSEDRVHRIGQDSTVKIYDICALGTLDEVIIKSLKRKENLANNFKKILTKHKNLVSGTVNREVYYHESVYMGNGRYTTRKKLGQIKEEKIEVKGDLYD